MNRWPLAIRTTAASLLITVLPLSITAHGQSSTPQPAATHGVFSTFEVATIKPSKPDELTTIQVIGGRRFSTKATSLIDILKYCDGVHARQIVDGPAWMATQKFDILAEPSAEGRPTSDEMKRMVQKLVTERFNLAFHESERALPVYAIILAKNGPKLTKSIRDPNGIPLAGYSSGALAVGNATMTDFATFLQRYVTDRPVVDRTGVAGKYDLKLRWTPDNTQPSVGRSQGQDNTWPGLYTAIDEQLGLKLKATKAPVKVLVIEHIDMPSEN